MAQAARLNLRMQKELKLLLTDPPPGASFPNLSADSFSTIEAEWKGRKGLCMRKGFLELKLKYRKGIIRYPFQAPNVTFCTPIYHPNIDNGGRICLDILTLPPKGAWQPSLNISTVLTSIGLLLSEPNPDDGLMCEASKEYKYNRQAFDQKARAMTEKYAKSGQNCSKQCTSPDLDSRIGMEAKGPEELEHGTNDFDPIHQKTCQKSRKLSLESSSSTLRRDSDIAMNDMLNYYDNYMGADGGVPCGYNLGYKKVLGTRSKLSLESSVGIHKLDDHDMKKLEPEPSNSVNNSETISVVCSGSALLQVGNCDELGPLSKAKCDNKNMNSKKLCQVRQELLSGSLDDRQTSSHCINENRLVTAEQLPSQSHRTDRIENNSTAVKGQKVFTVGQKLPLGSSGSVQGLEKDDKENIVPIHKVPNSNVQNTRKTKVGRKLCLGPLSQLEGSNEENSQLHLHSQNFYTDRSKKQQFTRQQNGKLPVEINQHEEDESAIAESVIVLDSEDSEEESNRSVRSKLSVGRKRTEKRKAHA